MLKLASAWIAALLLMSLGCGDVSTSGDAVGRDISFDSQLLAAQGLEVIFSPSATPTINAADARKVLGKDSPLAETTSLVGLRIFSNPNGSRVMTGDFLAWAIDLDHAGLRDFLESFACNGWAYPGLGGINNAVVFVDATDGTCLGFYMSQSGDVVKPY